MYDTGKVDYLKSDKSFNTEKFLMFLKTLDFPENTIILLDNVS